MDGRMTVGLLVAFSDTDGQFHQADHDICGRSETRCKKPGPISIVWDDVLRYENDPAYLEGRTFDPSFDKRHQVKRGMSSCEMSASDSIRLAHH